MQASDQLVKKSQLRYQSRLLLSPGLVAGLIAVPHQRKHQQHPPSTRVIGSPNPLSTQHRQCPKPDAEENEQTKITIEAEPRIHHQQKIPLGSSPGSFVSAEIHGSPKSIRTDRGNCGMLSLACAERLFSLPACLPLRGVLVEQLGVLMNL